MPFWPLNPLWGSGSMETWPVFMAPQSISGAMWHFPLFCQAVVWVVLNCQIMFHSVFVNCVCACMFVQGHACFCMCVWHQLMFWLSKWDPCCREEQLYQGIRLHCSCAGSGFCLCINVCMSVQEGGECSQVAGLAQPWAFPKRQWHSVPIKMKIEANRGHWFPQTSLLTQCVCVCVCVCVCLGLRSHLFVCERICTCTYFRTVKL